MTPFESAAREIIASRGSPGTRSVYAGNLHRWLAHCAEHEVDPASPALADATKFRDLLQETLKSATVRQVLASLSGIYGKLVMDEIVKRNPFHPKILDWPSAADFARTEAVPADVAQRMIAACEADAGAISILVEPAWTPKMRAGIRDAAILHLLYGTGLRRASVATMRRKDVRGLGKPGVDVYAVVTLKGGGEGEVSVPAAAAHALERWLVCANAKSLFVFPGKKAGTHVCLDLINKIVNARAKQAGAAAHPHAFRAAFVTGALDAGVPLREVQASVQHSSADTTVRYDRGKRGRGVAAALEKFRRGT